MGIRQNSKIVEGVFMVGNVWDSRNYPKITNYYIHQPRTPGSQSFIKRLYHDFVVRKY